MAERDDDVVAAPLTPLERAMEALDTAEERVVPLYNAGCCQSCGHHEGETGRRDRRARGYVFWHDGCVEAAALDGVLTLYHRSYSNSQVMNRQVPRRVARVFESHGMAVRWGGGAGNAVHVELHPDDRAYFETLFDEAEEADEEFERELQAEGWWRTTVYKAFFDGLRKHREAVAGLRRRRAGRVIKDAVMDWAFRPGGPCASGAKRSFEDLSV